MRRIVLPWLLVFVLFTALSCDKGGNGGGGGGGTPTQTLTVSVSKSTVVADGFEEVTITVKDQDNTPVTTAAIYVNGSFNSAGYTFQASTQGTYQITAKKGSATSAPVTVTATSAGPSPFTQKVYVEDFTGTWCGYCPRVGASLESYASTHPKCIVVAIHGPAGSSDPYSYQYVTQLTTSFGVTGWPTGIINRNYSWNEQTAVLTDEANKRAPLGLSINSTINGSIIDVTAKVKYDVTTRIPMKLVVLLVEDGLVYPQVNYYAPTYGPNPITGYVHNNVLRKAATDIFGDPIPGDQQNKGATWEKSFQFNAAGYSLAKCKIVAFVVYGSNPQGRKGILNAQVAQAGIDRGFD